jgi:ribosome-binding protein aMBF1 (putative translation factor)
MTMKLTDLKSLDQVVEEHRQDEDFRVEWDRLAFAREVANRVVRYRVDNGLSQRELAGMVGLVQPQVARLEKAEHQPSFETLVKLSRATGLEFRFEVTRGGVELLSA